MDGTQVPLSSTSQTKYDAVVERTGTRARGRLSYIFVCTKSYNEFRRIECVGLSGHPPRHTYACATFWRCARRLIRSRAISGAGLPSLPLDMVGGLLMT